jgi:hypothetical protein
VGAGAVRESCFSLLPRFRARSKKNCSSSKSPPSGGISPGIYRSFVPAETFFPALTCPFQASFRTGALPGQHGLIANGLFFPELTKVLFWEQSHTLVEGARLWDAFRANGGKVGLMFWQQSMGEKADLIVTPAPIHKHSGGMIRAAIRSRRSWSAG